MVEPDDDGIDDVTLALKLALERLSPLERAALLLHDVFGLGFEKIDETIRREAAACRQLANRARTHVRAARPRFDMSRERGMAIAAAFFAASRSGHMGRLQALLAADVRRHADGGGKKPAAMKIIVGLEDVMKVRSLLARLFAQNMSRIVRYGFINGPPGLVTVEHGDTLQTTALQIEEGRIGAIYVVRNRGKLRHLDDTALR